MLAEFLASWKWPRCSESCGRGRYRTNGAQIVGRAFIPGDGLTNPLDTTQALAAGARENGVKIFERVSVLGLQKRNGRIISVETNCGELDCEIA